jgi:hypothetical protein
LYIAPPPVLVHCVVACCVAPATPSYEPVKDVILITSELAAEATRVILVPFVAE